MQQQRTSAARWTAILGGLSAGSAITVLVIWSDSVIAQMAHEHSGIQCTNPGLACASTVTPAFAPDGGLWIAWAAGGLTRGS